MLKNLCLGTYTGGGSYEGNWKNNKRHGYGKLIYQDGNIYDGEWNYDRQLGDTEYEKKQKEKARKERDHQYKVRGNCQHLYLGKRVRYHKADLFSGFDASAVVIGFSPQQGRATIKDTYDGYVHELSCVDIKD